MNKKDNFDPCQLMNTKGVIIKELPIPGRLKGLLTKDAIDVWKFSKRKVTDADGNILLQYSDTMTNVFAQKIEEFLSDKEYLNRHFNGKRPTDQEMASRAGFSRAKWNRLTGGTHLDIERGNAFAVAIALELNEKQTADLLYAGGFVLNYEHELDCAIMYFIKKEIYDINFIFSVLSEFCDIKNGLDKFTFNYK